MLLGDSLGVAMVALKESQGVVDHLHVTLNLLTSTRGRKAAHGFMDSRPSWLAQWLQSTHSIDRSLMRTRKGS